MKRATYLLLLAAACLSVGLAAGLSSSLNTPVVPGEVKILSDGVITDLSAAIPVPSIPANARVVYIQAQGGNIRYRTGDTDPTATSGGIIYAGTLFEYNGSPLSSLKIIEESSADAYYFYTN